MTYRFQSRATGDVLMLHPDGDTVLRLLGRQPAVRGIIEVDALSSAIAALEQASHAAARQRNRSPQAAGADDGDSVPPADPDLAVDLRQRTWPLLKLLKAAQAAGTEVVWGV